MHHIISATDLIFGVLFCFNGFGGSSELHLSPSPHQWTHHDLFERHFWVGFRNAGSLSNILFRFISDIAARKNWGLEAQSALSLEVAATTTTTTEEIRIGNVEHFVLKELRRRRR